MVQYASIDEAWHGCVPPTRYAPMSEPFDIARYDRGSNGSQGELAANARVSETAVDGFADESAYPSYDRMYGTRSTDTLAEHADRGTEHAASGERYPNSMYASPRTPLQPLSRSGADLKHAPVYVSVAEQVAAQRRHTYDLLVFCLFGLLAVLVMHEVAVMGESIGMERVAEFAADLSRRGF